MRKMKGDVNHVVLHDSGDWRLEKRFMQPTHLSSFCYSAASACMMYPPTKISTRKSLRVVKGQDFAKTQGSDARVIPVHISTKSRTIFDDWNQWRGIYNNGVKK